MRKTLIGLFLLLCLSAIIGELVSAGLTWRAKKMEEFELPAIHLGVEK